MSITLRGSRLVRGVLVAAVLAGSSLFAQAEEPTLVYTVLPQDTLIGLGRNLLVSPQAWPEVARLNRLPDPNLIYPNQALRVPTRLLRWADVPATLQSVEGPVEIDGRAAKAGDRLERGQRLKTLASSSAVLLLGDGSRVSVPPLTEMALAEHRRYQLKAGSAEAPGEQKGVLSGTLQLLNGALEILASKVGRAKPLEVVTPTAVIGVRGTQFRVRSGSDATTRTEVLEGLVHAEPGQMPTAAANVAGGQGAALKADKAPVVVDLQPAPDLSRLPKQFDRPEVRFSMVGEALALRAQFAADAGFERMVRDEIVAPGGEVSAEGLGEGAWFLRLRRIDKQGIEGKDATLAFVIFTRLEPPALIGPLNNSKVSAGTVQLDWAETMEPSSYRIEVARDAAFRQVVAREAALKGGQALVKLSQAGAYFWRVASVSRGGRVGPWGGVQRFELRAVPEMARGSANPDGSFQLIWGAQAQDLQRAQLARDPEFMQLVSSADLQEGRWALARPESPGTYYFRYRRVETDGYLSPWSGTLKIDIPRDWSFLWMFTPMFLAL